MNWLLALACGVLVGIALAWIVRRTLGPGSATAARSEVRHLKAAAATRRLERRVHGLEAQAALSGNGSESTDGRSGGTGRQARGRFFQMARTLSPLVSIETEDGHYLVASSDQGVGRSLFVDGRRDECRTLQRAVRLLRESQKLSGSLFLDIGANIGTTTIPALLRGGFASAIACEPDPGNFRLLQFNLLANGLGDRVQAKELAVSDTAGRATLALSPTNSGDHRLSEEPRLLRERATVDVETTTIDALLERSGHPASDAGLIWIDAQGHEAQILAGAARTLEAGIAVVCEFAPSILERNGSLETLTSLLSSLERQVIDLGADQAAARTIEEITARYADSGRVTDLLLVP